MKCINPYRRYWKDTLTGVSRWADCPCGRCIACLHNQQDAWSIRAQETSKAQKYMIYDTLTFANSSPALQFVDISDALENTLDGKPLAEVYLRPESVRLLRKSYRSGLVPFVERDVIRDWLKRGRENYFHDHGERLALKYLIFEEYGPKTSRPHFHLLIWGISPSSYYKYFALPWRRTHGFSKSHGFTRPKSLSDSKAWSKNLSCISKYVSKYCSKGIFESPLVKDGIQPPPFRVISNGVGEEYIRSSEFNRFLTDTRKAFREMGTVKVSCYWESFWRVFEKEERKVYYDFARNFGDISTLLEEVPISAHELDLFRRYVDSSGFSHALPRYYKEKILKTSSNNVLNAAVSVRLQNDAGLRRYQELQELATALQCSLPSSFRPSDPLEVLCTGGHRLLFERISSAQKQKALAAVEGCKTRLKNHYFRSLRKSHNSFIAQ